VPAPKRKVPQLQDRWDGRPLAQRIVNRLCELSRQYRLADKEGDEETARLLEKRIRGLESYVIVLLSNPSRESERNEVILNFARTLLPKWRQTWAEFKRHVDDFERRIRAKGKGRPPDYRAKITEAWERKYLHSNLTWNQIARDLGLPCESLPRQIRGMRAELKREGIFVPSLRGLDDRATSRNKSP
jgi:hypothetical protein